MGLGVARALAEGGAQVAIGDARGDAARAAAAQLGDGAVPIDLDVTSHHSVSGAVATAVERFGGLDALVTCAGVIDITPLEQISEDEWDRTIDIDLKGTFLCCQAAAPHLRSSGRGRIVTVGSDASHLGFAMIPHYCAAKHGVVGLTKSLAGELAPDRVTVNCVCPIQTPETDMGQGVLEWKRDATGRNPEELQRQMAAAVPLQRNGTVADVVNAVLFFLRDESSFLTGSVLNVDGGALSSPAIPGTD